MLLKELDYHLPSSFIAQSPAWPRDVCRLLVLKRQKKEIIHANFKDIASFLKTEGKSLIVMNDSRVFKARLYASLNTVSVEVLVLEKISNKVFEALLRPRRKVKENSVLVFADGSRAKVVDLSKNFIEFERDLDWADFERIGAMPLPPYIRRPAQAQDDFLYQTVYGRKWGSIAASTAGLHFTPEIMAELKKHGIEIEFITLHISYGTFRPIKSEILEQHPMLAEYFSLSPHTAQKINQARAENKKIVAVGTSVVRALESAVDLSQKVIPFQGFSELFIYPGYKFKVVDRMITNFHLPCSTPLALVAALAGKDFVLEAYQKAMAEGYRFYSYGDAMLIL